MSNVRGSVVASSVGIHLRAILGLSRSAAGLFRQPERHSGTVCKGALQNERSGVNLYITLPMSKRKGPNMSEHESNMFYD